MKSYRFRIQGGSFMKSNKQLKEIQASISRELLYKFICVYAQQQTNHVETEKLNNEIKRRGRRVKEMYDEMQENSMEGMADGMDEWGIL